MEKAPKYAQVYNALKQQITEGEYVIGGYLPSESELGKIFGVSRITIRKSIELLQREGFVLAQRGNGTRVLDYSTSQNLNSVTSISETLAGKGYKVVPLNVSVERIETRAKLAMEMGMQCGASVIHINRIQTADGKPIALMNNYLFPETVPGIEAHATEIVRLYDYLEEKYGIVLDSAEEHIRAKNATLEEAELLKIPIGTALLAITRISRSGAKIVCVDHVKIIADYYEYEVVMRGRYRHSKYNPNESKKDEEK